MSVTSKEDFRIFKFIILSSLIPLGFSVSSYFHGEDLYKEYELEQSLKGSDFKLKVMSDSFKGVYEQLEYQKQEVAFSTDCLTKNPETYIKRTDGVVTYGNIDTHLLLEIGKPQMDACIQALVGDIDALASPDIQKYRSYKVAEDRT